MALLISATASSSTGWPGAGKVCWKVESCKAVTSWSWKTNSTYAPCSGIGTIAGAAVHCVDGILCKEWADLGTRAAPEKRRFGATLAVVPANAVEEKAHE